jgi:hypothetical protein
MSKHKNTRNNEKKTIRQINRIFSYYNDLENKISLGRTYKYNLEKSFIKIYYDDERFICQTPMLFIPYKPRSNKFKSGLTDGEQYICDVDFYNQENDSEIDEFKQWIQTLENTIYKLLRKRSYLKIKKKGLNTIIKYDGYRDCDKLILKMHSQKSKLFELGDKGKIEKYIKIKDFEGQCYGLFILEIQSIWIKKPIEGIDEDDTVQWGIYFTVHGGQTLPNPKKLHSIPNMEEQFIQNPKMLNKLEGLNNIHLPPPSNHHLLGMIPSNSILEKKKKVIGKYIKMKSMGIPLLAIYQKMEMDGLQKEWLLNPDLIPMENINKSTTCIDNTINTTNTDISNYLPKITIDIISGVSLKKRTPEEIVKDRSAKGKRKKELLKTKALGGLVPKGFAVELDDILNIKSRLKSIIK